METNITDQKYWRPDTPLGEPHFDDEATLLSARPVVPLAEVPSKTGFSRPWAVGLAFAGALVLGVSATAFYYSRYKIAEEQSLSSIGIVAAGVQGVTLEPAALNESWPARSATPDSSAAKLDEKVTKQIPHRPTSTGLLNSPGAVPKRRARIRDSVVERDPNWEYVTPQERRAARREAKERKRAKREQQSRKQSDDILRVREIFEGPTRP